MVDRFFADRSSGRNGTVECVLASDYDALAADKAELLRVLAAADAQIQSLQNKWASRPLSSEDQGRRIEVLEAALRGMIDASQYETPALIAAEKLLAQAETDLCNCVIGKDNTGCPVHGDTAETEVFKGMKDAPTWIDDETKGE